MIRGIRKGKHFIFLPSARQRRDVSDAREISHKLVEIIVASSETRS